MKQLVVTAGVLVENRKLLMAKRHAGDTEGGKWEFPGGKVEWGEEPRQGLRRELLEELGLEVSVGRILEVVSVFKADFHIILLYFECQRLRGIPAALECQQVLWFTPGEVDQKEKPQADQLFWEKHRQQFV